MFIGEYQHSIDEKGRLAAPAKFRKQLLRGVVVTRGLDNCLFVYTRTEWEKLVSKLAVLPVAKANSRAFSRLMLAGAMDVELDSQGRIGIPEYLRRFAGLGKQVIIAGLYNRLEIWDVARWEEYKRQTEGKSNEIAEALGELGV
ncbi:MAG: division/cell wall cluster transcriptional repressor MraZ [Patescibacteria group bacterium]|nr:division/cell wall cluster transcriptional repressor MraZ [Patescibacteria group bacterium]